MDSAEACSPRLALDLGCGPGWSTQLIAFVLKPMRTVGLDFSDRYIAEARSNHPKLEFLLHEVRRFPFPAGAPDLLFCRFLLTHLAEPLQALKTWADVAAPKAILLIHENEKIESPHPSLHRYYELVDQMQQHYGQLLNVGASLEANLAQTGWRIRENRTLALKKPAQKMAQLHLPNLRTWRNNAFAAENLISASWMSWRQHWIPLHLELSKRAWCAIPQGRLSPNESEPFRLANCPSRRSFVHQAQAAFHRRLPCESIQPSKTRCRR